MHEERESDLWGRRTSSRILVGVVCRVQVEGRGGELYLCLPYGGKVCAYQRGISATHGN